MCWAGRQIEVPVIIKSQEVRKKCQRWERAEYVTAPCSVASGAAVLGGWATFRLVRQREAKAFLAIIRVLSPPPFPVWRPDVRRGSGMLGGKGGVCWLWEAPKGDGLKFRRVRICSIILVMQPCDVIRLAGGTLHFTKMA